MHRALATFMFLMLLLVSRAVVAGEPVRQDLSHPGTAGHFAPRGGWFPDCGRLLSWFPQCCFPNCTAPDDYNRKPTPEICWPAYSSDYAFGRESCSRPVKDATIRTER